MENLVEYLVPWVITNVVAILLLIAAIWKPKLSRLLFSILFGWACWINYTTANNTPEDYLNYATLTPFEFYREFINGWFKEHVTIMVTLISIGQGMISIGMLLNKWFVRLACVGAIVFLMAIAPLGIGAGFPFSITVSIALYFILKKDGLNFIWKKESH